MKRKFLKTIKKLFIKRSKNAVKLLYTSNFQLFYDLHNSSVQGVSGHFKPKQSYQKNSKKDFNLYQVFMYNFLDQNALILPNYVLFTRRMNTFWSRVLKNFGLGVLRYFGSNKKSHKKN